MVRRMTQIALLLLLSLLLVHLGIGEPKIRCIESEREALLNFKRNLGDNYTLYSWGLEQNTECCQWPGIQCSDRSGHVVMLDLSPWTSNDDVKSWSLRGNISSLLGLRYLNHLDLSFLDLTEANDWIQIVYELPYLEKLLLPGCNLPELNSPSLSFVNSSKSLSVLDLSGNNLSSNSVYPWLFKFNHSLVDLNLSSNKLRDLKTLEAFGEMSALKSLRLRNNQLRGSIPEAFGKMSLVYLDLGFNMIEDEIPKSLWNICTLHTLDLSSNNLSGELPDFAQSLSVCANYSLKYVDLSSNRVRGSLPNLTLFPSLTNLLLSSNELDGTVSESIGQLSQLEVLDISRNSLEGVISEAHFLKLSKLVILDLSFNPYLIVNISSDWLAPFELDEIRLRSCKLGPQFPQWLKSLRKNHFQLDISNSSISDSIPDWFWGLCTVCIRMNVSNNKLSGTIQNSSTRFIDFPEIDLSSNNLEGPVPSFLFEVAALDVSKNRFSNIDSLCRVNNVSHLSFLDMSYNEFLGAIPDCWSYFKNLKILILANNKLSGKIPTSIGSLTNITTLHLGNNNLTGELPASLKNCKKLMVFDVGRNKLSGRIPTWIGQSLLILSLRSNQFYGSIPSQLCDLIHLQLLDFSQNSLVGSIPKCLDNFSTMRTVGSIEADIKHLYTSYESTMYVDPFASYDDKLLLVWKGILSEFNKTLRLVKSIDLSSNKLEGEIPREITELVGLVSLNLSRNSLSGQIPLEIGELKSIDALDLSNNKFSGEIPSSLSQVDRLSLLDLSNNNLSGKIPTSTQLQSFDASSYMGNPGVCGAPLPKKCPGEEPTKPIKNEAASNQDDQDKFITEGFYISIGLGFVAGFWGVLGILLFNTSWRYPYIKFLNDVSDWILVKAAIYIRRSHRG